MIQLAKQKPLSAHTPGHKNGLYLPTILQELWGQDFAQYDFTEIGDLDNLHYPEGCIAQSQAQVAQTWNAKHSYYLVNGTTVGLQAAIMVCCYHQLVFVPRHVHRSIYHSLILAQAKPIYLPVSIDEETGLPLGISPETLEKYIHAHPQCKNLIMVNPTYQGITWQNIACVQLAKSSGLTVIVDEAHGSHLHFNDHLPASLLDMGADIVVQSWHKTLPVLTQGSVLHTGHGYSGQPLDKFLSLFQTTSPSYLIMASLEAGGVYMGEKGAKDIALSLEKIRTFAQWIKRLETIDWPYNAQWHQDCFKCYLHSNRLSGAEIASWLQNEYQIYAEMSDSNGCLLLLPLVLTDQWLLLLMNALKDIDQRSLSLPIRQNTKAFYSQTIPKQALALESAFMAECQFIPWSQAEGKAAGQFITKYPPGIPLIVPGEIIDQSSIELWQLCGGSLNDTLCILKE